MREAALWRFQEKVLPSVERVFGGPALRGLSFPWDRLFEIHVELPEEPAAL
ncbi:MAG: hypothetical protein K6W08_11700 [Firmicutes bacterium]|nr:hypothetical protein [Bacillota bacterium]